MGVSNSVRRAVRAEKEAEKAREAGEKDWRQAWWETTDALAVLPSTPQVDLTAATSFVADTLGQSKGYVTKRRGCGRHLSSLEVGIRATLPPRFAMACYDAKVDPALVAELIQQAEHEGASLREFNAMLTGRSWTNAPENMTDAERLHVARTELKRRPDEVMADDDVEEAVDQAWRNKRISRSGLAHVAEEQEGRLHNFDRDASKAFGLPEVPVQHLDAALGEIGSAMVAFDIHGLTDEAAWDDRLAKIRQAVDLAGMKKKSEVWTEEDQELLRSITE